jgi:hypothetical protein
MVVALISICRHQPLQFFEPIQSPAIGGQIDIGHTTGPDPIMLYEDLRAASYQTFVAVSRDLNTPLRMPFHEAGISSGSVERGRRGSLHFKV